MVERLFGNTLWFLVKQSDVVTKGVLLLLLGMSVLCWAIFFYKIILIQAKKKQLREAIKQMSKVNTWQEFVIFAANYVTSLPGYFVAKVLRTLKKEIATEISVQPAESDFSERVENQIEQFAEELVIEEESYMSVVSLCASVSPLIGLFGTVWGLVQAFVRIGELQSADIAAVAPGIAEALITTVAGLMVAIPAAVIFNVLMSQVRTTERLLYTFADTVVARLRLIIS